MNTPRCLRLFSALALAAVCSCATPPPGPTPTASLTLNDYVLTGNYSHGEVTFTLHALAVPPAGAAANITLLSGPISPTEVPAALTEYLEVNGSDIVLKSGNWPSLAVDLPFRANVAEGDGWKTVDFTPAAANIRKIVLAGWPDDAKVELPDASQAVRANGTITASLPGAGHVVLRWKDAPPETTGKLFFSATGAVVDTVSPGILRQSAQIILHVLQGKIEQVNLDLAGDGEVTHVDGPANTILKWSVSPGAAPGQRQLTVELNAPQAGDYPLLVQLETPLAALPSTVQPPRLSPAGASSYGGLLRVQNEGTVRLEVANTTGLSQIAPEQFQIARPANTPPPTQAFAYRFADSGYAYAVNADNVLPEYTVDSIIAYHLGDADTYLEAELNLDIREAPLRELNLLVPADWAISVLQAPNLADHFLTPADNGRARLRLLFAQPISGRQVVRLKLERNATPAVAVTAAAAAATAPTTDWVVPPLTIDVKNEPGFKSARGFVGIASDLSLRLTAVTMENLEDATAAFPIKLDNLQTAWRFREEPWSATVRVEHLASSVQADTLHIFSIGQEIMLGSTVLNYNIAGAPVDVLRLQNTGGYRNIAFTGLNKPNAKLVGDVYEVHLDHAVSGPYSLLATYELPFKATGDTLPFTGLRPLDVQSEQGHILLASSFPFTISPAKISSGLTLLESAEIPAEYRLLCDAPILACYQFSARPFDASLQLQPLVAGSTVDQVVDIAALATHVSATGEVRTTARYLLKSKGSDYLQLAMPAGATLWNITVSGTAVVPMADKSAGGEALRVPLPRKGDPNLPLLVELEYTAAAQDAAHVTVAAPSLHAPVLVTDWDLTGDTDRELRAAPGAPMAEVSRLGGLAWLAQTISGDSAQPRPPIVPYLLKWRNPPAPRLTHRQAFLSGLVLALGALVGLRWARHRSILCKILGGGLAMILAVAGVLLLAQLGVRAAHDTATPATSHDLHFSIPVTEADHALSYSLTNAIAPKTAPQNSAEPMAWLLLPGIILALLGWLGDRGTLWCALSWLLILAGLLGLPNGPEWFCGALALALAWANGRALLNLRLPNPTPAAPKIPAPLNAATTALLIGALWLGTSLHGLAATAPIPTENYVVQAGETLTSISRRYGLTIAELRTLNNMTAADHFVVGQTVLVPANVTPLADPMRVPPPAPERGLVVSINQTGAIQDGFARIEAVVSWRAEKGNQLTLLWAPAVLTGFKGDEHSLTLGQGAVNGVSNYFLTANDKGTFKFSFTYEVKATDFSGGASAVTLPTPGGLVNQLTLDLPRADLEAKSDNAVALSATLGANGKPHISANFAPDAAPILRWSPRARDLSAEKPEFYADWRQLYAPAAGIVDGLHDVNIRLAQGQIKELVFSVPVNLTISQVDAAGLASWRFDPDQHQLHAYFDPARTSAFEVVIHSQASTKPLPYSTPLAPIRLDGAATDTGLIALATGAEVELGTLTPANLATVNLDDFPANLTRAVSPRGDTDILRRAYSYGAAAPVLQTEALAVEPDVRVDSLQRLSLGADRVLLAAHLNVTVSRAGIFKLSFPLPAGFELETVSGDQLSHQTESTVGADRIITLNLKGKTIGNLSFDIQLSAPGLTARQDWAAPRLNLTEANKSIGQLILLPELGLRPQIRARDNLTQVDLKSLNIDTPGALVFRLLQNDWSLALDIEQVAPHIQTEVLQDVTVREGSTEVRANVNYEIDNAGVRELRLQLPVNALGVHISGPQVSDAAPVDGQPGQWLVHLQRRSIGALPLAVSYQLPPAGADNQLAITGLQTLGVDLQRGYVDVRSRGRLETRVAAPPPNLQATDWESIPAALRHDFDGNAPSQTFRAVEPGFTLPVQVVQHEAAKVLPARVESVHMRSLVASDGQLLTEVTVSLFPGDERNLAVTLPADSKFWFAFVNDKGVSPSQGEAGKDEILLPLEPNPLPSEAATVEFLYQQKAPAGRAWDNANLAGPSFDLPLQNISWQLLLPETWKISHWTAGAWQKTSEDGKVITHQATFADYQRNENVRLDKQNAEAENFLVQGNQLLQQGQQMQARSLFDSAFQISQKDSAFNEDARVQLQNLRETQAMVGLANGVNTFNNVSQNSQYGGLGGNALSLNAPPPINPVLSQTEVLNFTDTQARKILSANAAEQNTVLATLAHSLVNQQADTLPHPVAIHATLPERGTVYEFTQSLLVNPKSPLSLNLTAGPVAQPFAWKGIAELVLLGLVFGAVVKNTRKPARA
jgi:LysM repeat protein